MYLTQTDFFGKTGPIERARPSMPIPEHERTYPNRWMEERTLRSLHKKNNSLAVNQPKNPVNIENNKYLDVSY